MAAASTAGYAANGPSMLHLDSPAWMRHDLPDLDPKKTTNMLGHMRKAFNVQYTQREKAQVKKQYSAVAKGSSVEFDTEGIFKGSDGHDMTQEEIDQEMALDVCIECEQRDDPDACDDGDTCAGCKEYGTKCIRPDDGDAQQREDLFNNTRAEVLQILQSRETPPNDILGMMGTALPYFRRAWKEGRTTEIEAGLRKTNDSIRGMAKLKGFTGNFEIPFETILESFNAIRLDVLFMLDSPHDQDMQRRCTLDIAVVVLQMAAALSKCGLRVKDVANPWIVQAISTILEQGSAYIPGDMMHVIQAFWIREQSAKGFQLAELKKVEKPIREFFSGLDGHDVQVALRGLRGVEEVNRALKKANEDNEVDGQDRCLPVSILRDHLLEFQGTMDDGQSRESIADSLKAFVVMFLMKGVSEAMSSSVRKTYSIDAAADSVMTEDLRHMLTSYETQWRLGYSLPADNGHNPASQIPSPQTNGRGKPVPDLGSEEEVLRDRGPASEQLEEPNGAQPSNQARPQIRLRPRARPDVETETPRSSAFYKEADGQTKGPPVATGVPGPAFHDNGTTQHGTVMQVRSLGGRFGRGSYRAIVNIGTPRCKVYQCLPGSAFGRGMGEELHEQFGSSYKDDAPFDERRASQVERIVAYAEVESSTVASRRAPIGYFLIHYSKDPKRNPFSEAQTETWTTRSDATRLLGKRSMTGPRGYETQLKAERAEQMKWLEHCQTQGLHPDTGKPVTKNEREQMPWIFATSAPGNGKQSDKRQDPTEPVNVGVGAGWSPPASQ